MSTPLAKYELSLREILFGSPGRSIPDEIDKLCLAELAKAGDRGLTLAEVCSRLLGRELTAAEFSATDYVDEASRTDLQINLALFDAILAGRVIDTGERSDDGLILWAAASG